MQSTGNRPRSKVLMAIGVLIIVAAGAAYVYTVTRSLPSYSQSVDVSSLSSVISSLSNVVSTQSEEIQSLQSSHSEVSQNGTVTVTKSGSTTQGSTFATTVTTTVSETTTSISTTFETSTEISTTTLSATGSDLVSMSGSFVIPGGNGSGTLQLTVADTGNDPITAIAVQIPTGPDPTMDLCTTACSITLSFNGVPVSSANWVPGDNNAAGTLATDEGMSGQTYTLYANVVFADGMTQTTSVTLSAQT